MPSFDDRKGRSLFNPEDKRPDGPIKVELTELEAQILKSAFYNAFSDRFEVLRRERRSGGSVSAGTAKVDWDDYKGTEREVILLLGKGINGFEPGTLNFLQEAVRSELLLSSLDVVGRLEIIASNARPRDVRREELGELLRKLGGGD